MTMLLNVAAVAVLAAMFFATMMSVAQTSKTQRAAQLHAADAAFKTGTADVAHNDLTAAHKEFAKVVRLAPQIAAGHSALGAVLLAEGNLDAAVVELEQARHLDTNDLSTSMNLAIAYSKQNANAKSVALFDTLVSEHIALPSDASDAYARALDATGNTRQAETVLEVAVANTPDNAVLLDDLGTVYAEQKKFSEAEAEFKRAVAIDASSANPLLSPLLHLGSLYLLQRNFNEAIPLLSQTVNLAPLDFAANLQLGKALQSSGQDEQAVTVLRHAIEINKSSVDAAYALALALQSTGHFDQALPLFQRTAAVRPDDAAVLTNLGLALVQSGEAKAAVPLYQRALRSAPSDPVLRQDLGVAYLQQNSLDEAMEQFRIGLALDAENPQLHYDLGLALKLKDKIAEAIPEFELAEKEDASLPNPPYTLGVLYMQTGRFADAARELERTVTLRAENGDAWSILGSVYKQMDEPAKAAAALRRAISLQPQQPSPHILLAAVLTQQGDTKEAAAERKIAADLSRVAVSQQRAQFALDSGKLLLQRGRIAEAVEQFKNATAANPGMAEAHRELARALEQQGRPADAAAERSSANALDSLAGTTEHP